jgi:hypothetical protein
VLLLSYLSSENLQNNNKMLFNSWVSVLGSHAYGHMIKSYPGHNSLLLATDNMLQIVVTILTFYLGTTSPALCTNYPTSLMRTSIFAFSARKVVVKMINWVR